MWLFSTTEAVNKEIKAKENLVHNHVNNVLRLFDGLPNFSFPTKETKRH